LTREDDSSFAKDLRPDQATSERIKWIIDYPDFLDLETEQSAFLWRYRYSLVEKKEALVKFLLSVDWTKDKEQQEAMSLLNNWAQIEVEQALPLLSNKFCVNDIYSSISLTS